jgi:hypothetical protein
MRAAAGSAPAQGAMPLLRQMEKAILTEGLHYSLGEQLSIEIF